MSELKWNDVKDGLPKTSGKYNVILSESRYPTSSYDTVDSPYSAVEVDTFRFDAEQKIWNDRDYLVLNALINPEEILNGYFITHWLPLPKIKLD